MLRRFLSGSHSVEPVFGVGRGLSRPMMHHMLGGARRGLDIFAGSGLFKRPAEQRLAFRELEIAIGLHGVIGMSKALADPGTRFEDVEGLADDESDHRQALVRLGA